MIRSMPKNSNLATRRTGSVHGGSTTAPSLQYAADPIGSILGGRQHAARRTVCTHVRGGTIGEPPLLRLPPLHRLHRIKDCRRCSISQLLSPRASDRRKRKQCVSTPDRSGQATRSPADTCMDLAAGLLITCMNLLSPSRHSPRSTPARPARAQRLAPIMRLANKTSRCYYSCLFTSYTYLI